MPDKKKPAYQAGLEGYRFVSIRKIRAIVA